MTASNDTSHLYDGKTVRSGAPSRKKAAGRVTSSTEIPKDAIPEVHIPTFVAVSYTHLTLPTNSLV